MESKKRSVHTINTLLEELKEKLPRFEINQIFETLKSIYPDSTIPKEKRNILFEGKIFTKPLAASRRDKFSMNKEKNIMVEFFKDITKGDFLKVTEVNGNKAKCVNITIKESVINKYYQDDYIIITLDDVANGTVKPFKRKVDKYIGG